jgi:hypothetical protein
MISSDRHSAFAGRIVRHSEGGSLSGSLRKEFLACTRGRRGHGSTVGPARGWGTPNHSDVFPSLRVRLLPCRGGVLLNIPNAEASGTTTALRGRGGQHQTCLVEQRILRSEDSISTQNGEGLRNSGGYASLPALCRIHPFGPTPPASETLAGVSGAGKYPRARMIDADQRRQKPRSAAVG